MLEAILILFLLVSFEDQVHHRLLIDVVQLFDVQLFHLYVLILRGVGDVRLGVDSLLLIEHVKLLSLS